MGMLAGKVRVGLKRLFKQIKFWYNKVSIMLRLK
jgi:hypothetical protein